MLFRSYKRLVSLITIIVTVTFFVCFISNLSRQQQEYKVKITQAIQAFMQQQTDSLQRLGSNLLPYLREQNYQQISIYLAAYEDANYALAKQGTAIASSIQFVALNTPLLIISSKGILNENFLTPDLEYYNKAINDPFNLTLSKNYHKAEMPDYLFFNLGLGITDNLQVYYGQLDQKIALDALHNYLEKKDNYAKGLFKFELQNNNGIYAAVSINQLRCWLACASYMLQRLLLTGIILGIFFYCRYFHSKYLQNIKLLQLANTQLAMANTELQLLKHANMLQQRYATANQQQAKNINVVQLLQDVVALNLPLAKQLGINLKLPIDNASLYVYVQQYSLIQLLSGIVCETLHALQPQATLEVSLKSSKIAQMQQLEFCFSDNGYYQDLNAREINYCSVDIRCQGWQNIRQLAARIGASIEHMHHMYVGNKITVIVQLEIKNNVLDFSRADQVTADLT